jgi:hypothetical protein
MWAVDGGKRMFRVRNIVFQQLEALTKTELAYIKEEKDY